MTRSFSESVENIGSGVLKAGIGIALLGVGLEAFGVLGNSSAALSSTAPLGCTCDTVNAVSGIIG